MAGSMTLFWSLCALLVAVAVAFVAVPLLRRRGHLGPERSALNAAVYRDQLHELERELADGLMAPEQYAIARTELDRRALGEAVPPAPADGLASPAAPAAHGESQDAGTPQTQQADAQQKPLQRRDAPGPAVMAPQARLGQGRWLAPAALALIPVVAIAAYLTIGNPEAVQPPDQQFAQMVDELAQRLARDPDDIPGWVMLGRAYQLLGRMPDAVAAFEKASALKPDNAELLAGHADSLAMVQGSLSGKPAELIARALQLDPENQTALALAATAAVEERRFADSIVLWQRLGRRVDAGSGDRAAIDQAIAQVRQVAAAAGVRLPEDKATSAGAPADTVASSTGRAASAAAPSSVQAAAATPAASAAARITGEVTLAPELVNQAKPDEAVFVFARAVDGPPVPLAVLRARVADLPLRFTLDDSMSMAPGARLSLHKTVVVAARISRSGQALPQPGDLVGTVTQVPVGATGVQVRIADIIR
ncbi:MAG: c-type cytochrome biogenesis protein CcmI [Proteobacteria bacterium]|nr:c-type cytochrome biogenesis protein CcmI [Burkholderiales bacterium]